MTAAPITPIDVTLLTAAARTLPYLSVTDLESLVSLHNTVVHKLSQDPDFLLPVQSSDGQYLLPDTGILLAVMSSNAHLIFHMVEDNKVKIAHYSKDLSSAKKDSMKALAKDLSTRDPDHVRNVFRLWQEVLGYKREGVRESKIRQLGTLWKGMKGLGEERDLPLRGPEGTHC